MSNKQDEFDDRHYAAIGRRVEAERKEKEAEEAREKVLADEKVRLKAAVRESLEEKEEHDRAKARQVLKRAATAALFAGIGAFYVALIVDET